MANITLRGAAVTTAGTLPAVGSTAPDFNLATSELNDATLASFGARKKVVNIFPSLDTNVCATSVRQFHHKLAEKEGVVVINVSADLPFAHKRFCTAERLEGTANLSTFRSPEFGTTWGVTIKDGAMRGLMSRAVVVLDEKNKVLYAEQVPEIAQEPNYAAALAKL